jgi:hypothetical protein
VGGKLSKDLVGGALNIQLEPNDTAIPTGTSYTVNYSLSGVPYQEYWIVPTTSSPVTLATIRTTTVASPSLTVALGQIAQGGAVTGQCLAWFGAWQPVACGVSGSNATQIQGRNITATPPTDGQLLRWGASASQWQMVTLVEQETPAGTLDGTNVTFTLANAPNPALGLRLCRNGIQQASGGDYTISGSTITFISAATPQPGDTLLASYRY